MPRNPEDNPLYGVVSEHLETFPARQRERDRPVPYFVERELRSFLDCGVRTNGFLTVLPYHINDERFASAITEQAMAFQKKFANNAERCE